MKPSFARILAAWHSALCLVMTASAADERAIDRAAVENGGGTTLGIDGTRFTLNGKPVFLLGFSYYGGLGAPEEFVRRDLDDTQGHGFNWLRVWATWGAFDKVISAVDAKGRPSEPYLGRLKWLVAECDRRGIVVDVTLTRGERSATAAPDGQLPNAEAHRRAVKTLVTSLKPHRNWYLDLANERDVRDRRFVSFDELTALRELVRRLDLKRLVTASSGGDIGPDDLRKYVMTVGVDFVCPHRPRDAGSPARTEARTRAYFAWMKEFGRVVPVHYQEPFRRGYGTWEPVTADFLTDLRGARKGGAAGWCLHNGQQRDSTDNHPRRSFDLSSRRLFDQLDAEERKVVAEARSVLESCDVPSAP
jgi:hypothetical protein